MKVAQGLYEGVGLGSEGNVGLITYMRTDSTALSEDAVGELRQLIARAISATKRCRTSRRSTAPNPRTRRKRMKRFVPRPRCARRARVNEFLNDEQRKLYELIWKRTVACQMIHATMNTVSADFDVKNVATGDAAFRATGTTVIDPGFLAVYEEGRDQKNR